MIYFILLLNFLISWLNCWSCGRIWAESKALGGWLRLLAWCGAIQAAIGFSSVIGFALGAVLVWLGVLPQEVIKGAVSLWYLLIIIPVIGTGLIITIESWVAAWRDRSLLNMGAAAYNTYAQARNMYGAIDGIRAAFSEVKELFSHNNDDDPKGLLLLYVIALVVTALLAGVMLTTVLIKRYAGTLPDPRFAKAAH